MRAQVSYVSWSLNMTEFTQVIIEIEQPKTENIVDLEMPAIHISLPQLCR